MSDNKEFLDGIRLAFTEDPVQRRMEVLRMAALDSRANKTAGKIGTIAKHISIAVEKLMKRHRWGAAEAAYAMDHLVESYCGAIYEKAAELSAEDGE